MFGRRLEYHSQKAVLLHMDANVRFKISLHMPLIRSVEKVVPLKMDSLYLTEVTTWVNDNCFVVGVDRRYPDGTAPKYREDESNLDYDEFGFPFVSGHDVLLPGDISFQKENEKVRFDTEEDEREYEQDLRHCEKALEILNDLKSKGVTKRDYLRRLENVPVESEEDRAVRNMLRDEYFNSRNLAEYIEGYKQELQSFDCRKNNSKRQFECYIQLYSFEGQEPSKKKRFEYNKKCFEASKYLNEVLFGGRTMPIRVKKLSLCSDAILRLPVGFQLQVQEASLRTGYLMQPLDQRGKGLAHENFPLIVENLESLDCLKVYTDELRLDGYKSRIVRNAKKLIIAGDEEFMEKDVVVTVIRDLQNREIGIKTRDSTMSKEFYTTVIQNWLNGGRQVGACLWMANRAVETGRKIADEVLKSIETRYERSERKERCVTVPLSNSTVMEVCSVPFEDSYWMLKLNILKV